MNPLLVRESHENSSLILLKNKIRNIKVSSSAILFGALRVMIITELRCMDTHPCFTAIFKKGINFCDFLIASQDKLHNFLMLHITRTVAKRLRKKLLFYDPI